MRDRKGQTLVLFIIFIPLLLSLAAFVIDTGIIIKENLHLKNVSMMVLKDTYDKDNNIELANNLFKKNKIATDKLIIKQYDNYRTLENTIKIDSVFGQVIGINEYTIKIKLMAMKTGENIIVKQEKE